MICLTKKSQEENRRKISVEMQHRIFGYHEVYSVKRAGETYQRDKRRFKRKEKGGGDKGKINERMELTT